jgi:hypothetical protein
MQPGDTVYVVEDFLIEEQSAALNAGEVGLGVVFKGYDSGFAYVIDQHGETWEIPPSAICVVPEGHIGDPRVAPCLACGLRLIHCPPKISPAVEGDNVIRPYRPPADQDESK